jgi:glycosyltransferase involved in cell wall biosynthesis
LQEKGGVVDSKNSEGHVPKVSIGMPVFNGGDLLKKALDTLLAQEFADFELIVSDNASTDSTGDVCRAYADRDKRIRYIRRDRNYGMADNGRMVLSLAQGEYFMFAAHDDQRHPQFIGACVERLDANPALVLVSPAVEFFSPDGTILDIPYPPLHTVGMGLRDRVASIFKEINVGFNSYGLYRRTVLDKLDLNIECFASDVVILLQLMFLGEVEHIPQKLFRYRFVKRTAQEHIEAVSKSAAEKHPTRLYTILTINLLRAIFNAQVSASLKRVLVSDAISIIALKNLAWRQMVLSENQTLLRFLEPGRSGFFPSVELNLLSAFAALLLPYCPAGAPYEGAIDFSDIEGFDAINQDDGMRPGPGHREFTAMLMQHLETRKLAQALAYHDEHRRLQPDSDAIRQISNHLEMFRPGHLKHTERNQRPPSSHSRRMRILLQLCGKEDSEAGWDAVIGERIKTSLNQRGHEATIVNKSVPGLLGYDIVHTFNLACQPEDYGFLNNAIMQRKPMVISALIKDQKRFFAKALHAARVFKKYIEQGQSPELYEKLIAEKPDTIYTQRPGSELTARYADRVIVSGATEEEYIKKQYPFAKTAIVPIGAGEIKNDAPAALFEKEFGVKDFVLCVAPLEIENNQLMLLKALEDEEIPVVMIGGEATAQPEYAQLCRKMKRRGSTIIIGSLSQEMLASAYRAARVHCAPGWYELPGLTTLTAALYGCAVVASSWGCISDYLGGYGEYAEPGSPQSIKLSVLKAFQEGPKKGLQEHVSKYTWEATVMALERIYGEVLS